MSKVAIKVGYRTYLLDTQEAVDLVDILAKAEFYEEKWHKEEEGGTTHHVYPQEGGELIMSVIPDHLCRMARLAGKPQEK
jgi:hypothetical protein